MNNLLTTLLGKRHRASARSRRGELLESRHHLSAQPLAGDPATANAAFVQAVYQDVLGRPADPAGLSWGVAQVNSGQPSTTFARQVVGSEEADADFIGATYQDYLGRNADPAGLNYWVREMQAGVSNQAIEADFMATDEFYALAGNTQSGWVQSVYEDALGRGVDGQALNWAQSQLRSGESLDRLAFTVLTSPEGSTRTVEQDLSKLQIPIDSSTVAALPAQLGAGQISEQQLITDQLGSAQYFDDHTGVPISTVPVPNVLPLTPATLTTITANESRGNANVVFVGDSITYLWSSLGISDWNQYFAPLGSLDAGVSGDTTQNVLWRLDNGTLNGISPKLAVLMIGVNNLGDGVSDVVAGVTAVVDKLQSEFPGIRVLLLGILPALSPAADSSARQEIVQVNQLIKPLADGQHVWFLDVDSSFLNPDGSMNTSLYLSDYVHPNAQGYGVLARAIAPWVQALA